jgi:hypothetical protein
LCAVQQVPWTDTAPGPVMVVEPGAVATELTDHITHADTKQVIEG